jgi:sterol desaturase/sphingolipid hydroxylase (fatty acid hydroxylase superfamily)
MKTETLLGLAVPLLFVSMRLIEARSPARPYEPMRLWPWLGTLFFILTLVVGALTPHLLPVEAFKAHQVFDLGHLGLWGVPIGVLCITFVGYWWHRAEHRFNWIWRATHQLHHSPTRVDLLGAFYTHPLEVVLKVCISTLIGSFVLGLAPLAASAMGLTSALLSLFQHWNIHTPQWLGYLVQRPESHARHHASGVQTRNFSDLPLWDIVFGTFANPHAFNGKVGLGLGLNGNAATPRVWDLLLMRDAGPQP